MPFCFQVLHKFFFFFQQAPSCHIRVIRFFFCHTLLGLLFLCCLLLLAPLSFGDDSGLGDAAGDPFIQHLPSTPVSPLSTGQHNCSSVLWGVDCSFKPQGSNHFHLGVLIRIFWSQAGQFVAPAWVWPKNSLAASPPPNSDLSPSHWRF